MLPIVLAILCYISPPSQPVAWLVSGKREAVQEVIKEVQAVPSARLVATAADGETVFARFDLPADISPKEMDALRSDARQKGLVVSNPTIWEMCDDADLGLAGGSAQVPTVGLIGDEAAIDLAEQKIAWAQTFPFRLGDGEEGVAFRPRPTDRAAYVAFVQAVSKGELNDLDVVLVEPALE
jgi:hypothetical protein